jgi:iron complex outermembrane receptor protein
MVNVCLLAFAGTLPPKRFSLTIQVVDSISGNPLEAASITIAETHFSAITNALGNVRIDSLVKGSYTLQCAYIGYHSQQKLVWLDHDQTIVLAVCPESHHLHEVEITTHRDEGPNYAVQTRSVLDAQQLERTRGLTLADQLKHVPGITLMSTGPAITKPVIRGLHSNRLVTVNNGVRQEGQQWGADHGTEIDPFAANSIEIIKGAASVTYGSEAMGGVVRLIPPPFRTTRGITSLAQLQGATNNGLMAASMLVEGAHFRKNTLSWRAQGSLRKAGDSRSPEYVLSNTGFEEQSGSYAVHYAIRKIHLEFAQSYYHSQLGILRSAHIGNPTDLTNAIQSGKPAYVAPFTYAIENPKQDVTHRITSAVLTIYLKRNWHVGMQYSRQLNDREEYDRAPRASQIDLYNTKPAYQMSLTTNLAELYVQHSIGKYIKGKLGISYMNQGNVSAGLQPIIPNFKAYTYGVYLMEKWQHGRWMAEAGLRFDWREQTPFVYSRTGTQTDYRTYSGLTIVTGGAYTLNEHIHLQANISSAWRPPSINELYSYGLHGGTATFEIGNPNLNRESCVNSEAGIVFNTADWQAEASVYRNFFTGFIYNLPQPQPILTVRGAFPLLNRVQDNAVLQGIDASLNRNLGKRFSVGVNGAYLYAQNTSDNIPLIMMPANRLRLMLGYKEDQFWKLNNLFASFEYTFVAEQKRYPAGTDLIAPPPAYGLADVNVGFEAHIGKQPLRISISAYNLLNTSYRDYLSRFRYYALDPGFNLMLRVAAPINFYQPKT